MLWIVGPVAGDYYRYLREHAIVYGQFCHTGTKHRASQVIELDFSSPTMLELALRSLTTELDVTGIMVCGMESYVMPAARIAQHFGVSAMPLTAAYAATDKITMRQKLMTHNPAISPAFAVADSLQAVEHFFAAQEGPVMLKPANLMKSLFISKNDTLADLRRNYALLTENVGSVYAKLNLGEPRVLVEAYMHGSMHTVAGFVDAAGTLQLAPHAVDCITAQGIGVTDSYVYARSLPTQLAQTNEASLLAVAAAGVAALGLKSTPIHAELMLTTSGPKIIEIGARIGGFRPRMYAQAYGLDLYDAAIQTALGKPVDLSISQQLASTVIELFPDATGTFQTLQGIEIIQTLPTLQSLKFKVSEGQMIGRASDGYRAAAIVNLAGTATVVSRDMAILRDVARIVTATS